MKSLLILCLVLINLSVFATDTNKSKAVKHTTISGTITDRLTGETLAGVAVSIPSMSKTVYTDFYGNFKIDGIVPGSYTLKVSYISYKENTIADVKADINNDNNVTFQLEQKNK